MSDFSITTLFVVSNTTLATTGSTQNLLAGQVGIFDNAYVIGNSGTIATKPYIYIAQGRVESIPGTGSKRSDRIALANILEWYKVTAVSNGSTEIATIGTFTPLCQQDITVTIVAHSSYIDTLYYNGLTQSVTVTSDCCNCGTAPCTTQTGVDIDNLVNGLVAKLQQNTILANYFTFAKVGTGTSSTIQIGELPLTAYGQPCDIAVNPYEWDRIWFRAFVIANAPTTQDFQVLNQCSQVGVVTINQRSLYLAGSSDQIAQLEKNFYSYQTPILKALYRQGGYNEAFTSYVTPGTFYDTYYVKFMPYKTSPAATFTDVVGETETVILAWPTGTAGAFETLLTAYLGAPADKSSTNPTTTTTTSTTSTSTTSTTTLFP
jgi:hypothetical protein